MTNTNRLMALLKFVIFSGLGIIAFFVEIEIAGVSAIPTQHMTTWVGSTFGPIIPYFCLLLIAYGGLMPIIKKTYKKSTFDLVFTIIKFVGVIIGGMAVFNVGPAVLMAPDMIPFLFNVVVKPIALMIIASGLAYVLLINFGFMEFVSVFMQPIMRKIWKTPGESAIDAVVSFTGGYALAVLLTNQLYKKGVYTARESTIIATGFSTVAIGFMLVIANTLGLMDYWTQYFFSTLIITFAVTAITARIYPICKIPNEYYDKKAEGSISAEGNIFKRALDAGINTAANAKSYFIYLKDYYTGDAIKMSSAVTSSIMAIGLAGLLVAEYTPLFDIVGYIFYPFTLLLQIPDPMLAAMANATEIAEMFIPAMLVVESHIITKFVTAVTSVSAILFFSASIPCLLSTDIPIKMKDVLLIWVERTILSLIMSAAVAHILF